jgi:type VI secretion system protein VasJ
MTLEDIRARAKRWTAPVSPEAPAGKDARYDARYELALAEIAKLDSPTAGTVDWRVVVDQTDYLLQTTTKDLQLGAHLAVAMYSLHGLDDLITGVALLTALIEEFWAEVWPERKRLRARVNAIRWFVEHISAAMARTEPSAHDGDVIAGLELAVGRFVEAVRDQLGEDAPALGPFLEAVDRFKLSLPTRTEPPRTVGAAAETASASEAPPPMPAPPPAAAPPLPNATPSPRAPVPVASLPAPSGDAVAFLRQVGTALISGANTLRRENPAEPAAYRAVRTGLWLHLQTPPPASGGRTQVPAPPEALRQTFARMQANAKWAALLDESESCLERFRLWLDPHRFSAESLAALGPTYTAARQALIGELAAFLRRVPSVIDLAFADGSALASPETRSWIDAEVLPRPMVTAAPALPAADDSDVDEARVLASQGKLIEAVALLQKRASSASTAAGAFRTRLELARLLLDGNRHALACALYATLDDEVRARDLETWDPALAAACLEGQLRSVRASSTAGHKIAEEWTALYTRLGRINPTLALQLEE